MDLDTPQHDCNLNWRPLVYTLMKIYIVLASKTSKETNHLTTSQPPDYQPTTWQPANHLPISQPPDNQPTTWQPTWQTAVDSLEQLSTFNIFAIWWLTIFRVPSIVYVCPGCWPTMARSTRSKATRIWCMRARGSCTTPRMGTTSRSCFPSLSQSCQTQELSTTC